MKIYALSNIETEDHLVTEMRTRFFLFNCFAKKEKEKTQREIRERWIKEVGTSNLWELHSKNNWSVSIPIGENELYTEKLELDSFNCSMWAAIKKLLKKEERYHRNPVRRKGTT